MKGREADDPRDKFIEEFNNLEVTEGSSASNSLEAVLGIEGVKKRRLHLYGRGVTKAALVKKSIMDECHRQKNEEIKALRTEFEQQRSEDNAKLTNAITTLVTQLQGSGANIDVSLIKTLLGVNGGSTHNGTKNGEPSTSAQPYGSARNNEI